MGDFLKSLSACFFLSTPDSLKSGALASKGHPPRKGFISGRNPNSESRGAAFDKLSGDCALRGSDFFRMSGFGFMFICPPARPDLLRSLTAGLKLFA